MKTCLLSPPFFIVGVSNWFRLVCVFLVFALDFPEYPVSFAERLQFSTIVNGSNGPVETGGVH